MSSLPTTQTTDSQGLKTPSLKPCEAPQLSLDELEALEGFALDDGMCEEMEEEFGSSSYCIDINKSKEKRYTKGMILSELERNETDSLELEI